MKIILSRKGFDSGYGKCASPIIGNELLSLPIPTSEIHCRNTYSDLHYKDHSYLELIQSLNPKFQNSGCHLDPDIRDNCCIRPEGWKPAFGQAGAAQTHLKNHGVGTGDIFLFFGWFRKTARDKNNQLKYEKGTPDLHVIFGYMQIGKILTGKDVQQYSWHPHADTEHLSQHNNTLYLPTEKLIINGVDTGKRGYGTLPYSESRILTKSGMSRTRWKLPAWFRDIKISYHSSNSFKDNYFQSASIGQEFVISENKKVTEWAKHILLE